MKLRRVEVLHFACIRSATVDLGPGLNVLFGPNDLGKSTLARAIRAALLVQHSSNLADEFVEWDSDETPSVKVTFEGPDKRIWRVEKDFGAGARGKSLLYVSNDGVSFSIAKKAREVDEELRTMLRWGIASPATRGAPRGLPTSFLSTVLLGEQTDVAGVLGKTLELDTDESGRAWLTQALAAYAQNPLFKRVLAETQAKVDEAYTATGKKKSGKTSPFREVTEDVKRVKDHLQEIAQRVQASETAVRELEARSAERDRWRADLDDAQEHLEKLQGWRQQVLVRRAVAEELQAARTKLQEKEDVVVALNEREAIAKARAVDLEHATQEWSTLERRRNEAFELRTEAQEAVRRVASAEAEKDRQLRAGELNARILGLDAQILDLQGQIERLRKARTLDVQIAEVERSIASLATQRSQLEARATEAEAILREADVWLAQLDVASRSAKRNQVRKEIEQLELEAAAVEADRAKATEHRQAAAKLEGEIDARLPDASALDGLRRLRQELDLAEASLGGGLAVRIERLRAIELAAVADGVDVAIADGDVVQVEAERALVIRVGDVARLTVSAGEREARASVERLQERWDGEAVPVLMQASARDLGELTARVADQDRRRQAIRDALQAATALEDRAEVRARALTRLDDLRAELAALDRELAGANVEEVERAIGHVDAQTIETRRAHWIQKRDRAAPAQVEAREKLRAIETDDRVLAERATSLRATEIELGVPRPAAGWQAEDARLADELTNLRSDREHTAEEHRRLDAEKDTAVADAESKLADATAVAESLEGQLTEAAAKVDSYKEEVARLEGDLAVRRETVASLHLDDAHAHVLSIQARLDALPLPAGDADDEAFAAAARSVEYLEGQHRRAVAEVQKAEGALQTVGGQVVREQQDRAQEALRLVERKERDVEIEYEAWRLLAETLREAETTEGAHLGAALGAPVSDRFRALTAGRYGALEVEPNLRAARLHAAGAPRDVDSLSVGTREQLATLLRLTVAEHIGCALVLDDHLTQTDPARSAWFRDVLRVHAQKGQVVVLTCRPLDYLIEGELPIAGELESIRAAGLLRVVDLAAVIHRGAPVLSRAGGAT